MRAIFLIIILFVPSLVFAESKNSLKGAFSSNSSKNEPLLINSNNLSLDATKRVFIYSGNVKLKKGEIEISSDRLIGEYGVDNQIHTVTCDDHVVITKGEGMKAKSEHAVYHVKQETIDLTEAPELYKDGSLLAADKIKIYIDQDKSEAEGNVRVKVVQENEVNFKR